MTLRDVARAARVSEPTVSRSLRDDPQISAPTRAAVKRIADKLGYLPNASARSLATRRSHTLGLLVPDLTDPVHGQIVLGFEREAGVRDHVLLIANFLYDAAAETRALRALMSNQADGVCVFGGVIAPDRLAKLCPGTNLVLIGPEDRSALKAPPTRSAILADDESGVAEVVAAAIDAGYRRFAYLSGPNTASNIRRRTAAVRAIAERPNSEPLRVYEFDASPIDAICGRLVGDRRDIVLCYDDQRALRLLSALRDARIDVPRQLAVVGFDDIPMAALSNPRLTSISVPHQQIGRLACDMLLTQLQTGRTQPTVQVPTRMVPRETTAIPLPG